MNPPTPPSGSSGTFVSSAIEDEGSPRHQVPVKVKIVSWNLGDALPKGDLGQLFGPVPDYEAPTEPLTSLPDFGVSEDPSHPFHLIIIANQECPTQSGIPRGIGAGVAKGMGGQREKDKLKERGRLRELKETEKIKDEIKDVVGKIGIGHGSSHSHSHGQNGSGSGSGTASGTQTPSGGAGESKNQMERIMLEAHLESQGLLSPTISPHHGHHSMHVNVPSAKGWSDMLEEYFCHGAQQPHLTKSKTVRDVRERRDSLLQTTDSPENSSPKTFTKDDLPTVRPIGAAAPPPTIRTFSSPPDQEDINPDTPTRPIHIPPTASALSTPRSERADMLSGSIDGGLAPSPSSIASSYISAVSPPIPLDAVESPSKSIKDDENHLAVPQPQSHAMKRKETMLRLGKLQIPDSNLNNASAGTEGALPPMETPRRKVGPYHFLAKERLMGLYLAIFVHRDCLPFVQGHDKSFVTTGLMGGRVGNKGGIGMSLKFADHRFLFVCAHLAAHASQMNTRISNVEKIQAELGKGLETFLPQDDPGNQSDDLFDRFDTAFLFGDLNFRLDVSRLHADWLINRKEYAQALQFDQLRNGIADGKLLDGFQEGDIDFAPTFKYDVWHSVKKMRRKGDLPPKERKDTVNGIPEVEEEENAGNETEQTMDDRASMRTATTADRRASVDSTMLLGGRMGGLGERDEESVFDEPATVPQPARPISAVAKTGVIKARHRIKNFFKGSGSSTPSEPGTTVASSYRDSSVFSASQPVQKAPSIAPSIADSVDRISIDGSRFSVDTDMSRPSLARGVSKRLKRTLSNRQAPEEESSSSDGDDCREGVYDSSTKQRVPSWCDRVLWKTHIQEDIGPQPRQFEVVSGQGRIKLFGHAIADKFHRRNRERSESVTIQDRLSRILSNEHGLNLAPPKSTPPLVSASGLGPEQIVWLNEAANPAGFTESRSAGQVNHGKKLGSAVDLTSNGDGHGKQRPRSHSITIGGEAPTPHRPSPTSSPIQLGAPIVSEPIVTFATTHQQQRPVMIEGPTVPPRQYPRRAASGDSTTFPRPRTLHATPDVTSSFDAFGETSLASARRWLTNLPGLLMSHRHSSTEVDMLPQTPPILTPATEDVSRRKKGEVDCLKYDTLDDPAMRLLEGRSDHRPIIWSGAVYVE